MPVSKSTYHHGNLPEELVSRGLEVLEELGPDELSLREVARRSGVSHNAVYRHYADKKSLLAALASQGFRLLTETIRVQTGPFSGAPRTRLLTGARVYVHFGLEHPHLLRVMFSDLPHREYPELQEHALRTFSDLVENIESGQQQGSLRSGPPRQLALTFWSAVHGLTMLLIAQKIPDLLAGSAPDELNRLIRTTMEQVLSGLAAEQSEQTQERKQP